ncbi:MAG: type II secretion system F family protein [Minwuiales bacterium]|nr:type II secretion system F family protein [Minwuiales bacterium]
MPRFYYKAVRSDGELVEGEIEAINQTVVVERLRGEGQIPIRAEKRSRANGFSPVLRFSLPRKRVRPDDIVRMTRELAMLLGAGLPLDRALSTLGRVAAPGPMQAMVSQILDRVQGGQSLADALNEHAAILPRYYVGLVRAGEAGGSLVDVLERLADAMDRAQKLRESVRSALQYPALVVVMAVLSIIVLMTMVIPEFKPLFEDAGASLPVLTAAVIAVSEFVAKFWWLGLGMCLLILLVVRQHNLSDAGRRRLDRTILRAPILGELMIKLEVARFSRTLGTLLRNGVSVLDAVSITADTLGNKAVSNAILDVRAQLAEGGGLTGPLRQTGLFPRLTLEMLEVGEESGELVKMLLRLADIYDDEVKRSLDRMLALLVPLTTIALGVVIAVIVGSMISAILSAYDLPI